MRNITSIRRCVFVADVKAKRKSLTEVISSANSIAGYNTDP